MGTCPLGLLNPGLVPWYIYIYIKQIIDGPLVNSCIDWGITAHRHHKNYSGCIVTMPCRYWNRFTSSNFHDSFIPYAAYIYASLLLWQSNILETLGVSDLDPPCTGIRSMTLLSRLFFQQPSAIIQSFPGSWKDFYAKGPISSKIAPWKDGIFWIVPQTDFELGGGVVVQRQCNRKYVGGDFSSHNLNEFCKMMSKNANCLSTIDYYAFPKN